MPQDRVTVDSIRRWKHNYPILAVTAYDYSMARLLDEAGVDILHVGDSLGMVMLGYPDTTHVRMDDMLRATEAVARARKTALITSDLPVDTYKTPEQALKNSKALIGAGADAVKMEGGRDILPQIQAVRNAGIEIQGHLGMLPQRVHEEGGYKRKGKNQEEIENLKLDVKALIEAGIFSCVLELVVSEIAHELTNASSIPMIGIGSGAHTTGQVQVVHDVLGLYPWFTPSHAKQTASLHEDIRIAIRELRHVIQKPTLEATRVLEPDWI